MILDYMVPRGEQNRITEEYVSSPPAVTIIDERGDLWCLGFNGGDVSRGEYQFDVLRNGKPTGEMANRIERRNGKVRIYTSTGFKRWSGNSFI